MGLAEAFQTEVSGFWTSPSWSCAIGVTEWISPELCAFTVDLIAVAGMRALKALEDEWPLNFPASKDLLADQFRNGIVIGC